MKNKKPVARHDSLRTVGVPLVRLSNLEFNLLSIQFFFIYPLVLFLYSWLVASWIGWRSWCALPPRSILPAHSFGYTEIIE